MVIISFISIFRGICNSTQKNILNGSRSLIRLRFHILTALNACFSLFINTPGLILLFTLIFIFAGPHYVFSQKLENKDKKLSDSVIVLSSDSWHTLTMPDGSGLYFDLIRAVYEPVGISISLKIVPYARSVALVKAKKTDAWVASFMGEQPFPLYPKWHFDRNKQIAVSIKKGLSTFNGIESLRNRTVVWLRSFNLDKHIHVPMKFSEIDDINGIFSILTAGRAEFFIGAESDVMSAVKDCKIDASRFNFDYILQLKLYIAFADTDRGRKFREIWDRRMEKLTKQPEFRKIYFKYGYPVPFD